MIMNSSKNQYSYLKMVKKREVEADPKRRNHKINQSHKRNKPNKKKQ